MQIWSKSGSLPFMEIPVVFIHRGFSRYLAYALLQARITNANVHLIGDEAAAVCSRIVSYHSMNSWFTGAQAFASVYKHVSVNPLSYELFCFQRYFILRDFMIAKNIPRCFYADSDVMIYHRVDDDAALLETHGLQLIEVNQELVSAGSSFWTLSVLKDFCEFLLEFFRKHRPITSMHDGRPHFSDMYALRLFTKERPGLHVGDLLRISKTSMYDDNICHTRGFAPEGDVKKIFWEGGKPYAQKLDGSRVFMKTLHFFADEKRNIRKYFHGGGRLIVWQLALKHRLNKLFARVVPRGRTSGSISL